LDEESGTRYDSSTNGNDLTEHNTVGSATGQVGLAADLELDNSEYLDIADGAQSGLNITGSLTLVGWIKPERVDAYMALAGKYEWQTSNRAYRLNIQPTGQLVFIVSPDGTYNSSDHELVANPGLSAGAWYPVAGVFDAADQTLTIYVDGDVEATRSVDFDRVNVSDAPFMLGANLSSGTVTQYYDGMLDEWRAYGRALSEAEVEALMVTSPP
jgi:hypothetical protein